jgi:hypothetical protein
LDFPSLRGGLLIVRLCIPFPLRMGCIVEDTLLHGRRPVAWECRLGCISFVMEVLR